MAWCRLDDTFRWHPKIKKLAHELGISKPEARGLVTALWSWATVNACDGDLSSFDSEDIEIAADWLSIHPEKPGTFVEKMVKSGLLDQKRGNLAIHGYLERAESYKRAQQKQRERQRRRDVSRDVSIEKTESGLEDRTERTERTRQRGQTTTHSTNHANSTKPVKISGGRVVDGDDSEKNNWTPGQPITSVLDLESFASSQNWAVQLTSKDRGRVHAMIQAGEIQPHETDEGLARMGSSTRKRPVSYWLSCVEAARKEFAEESSRTGAPPTKSQEEKIKEAMERLAAKGPIAPEPQETVEEYKYEPFSDF